MIGKPISKEYHLASFRDDGTSVVSGKTSIFKIGRCVRRDCATYTLVRCVRNSIYTCTVLVPKLHYISRKLVLVSLARCVLIHLFVTFVLLFLIAALRKIVC
jgi:hypothetical protein